jgi:hypothetical protein
MLNFEASIRKRRKRRSFLLKRRRWRKRRSIRKPGFILFK